MGWFSFLFRKFRSFPGAADAQPVQVLAPLPALPAEPAHHADPHAMLCRDEMIDRQQRLCGYRFSLKGGGKLAAPSERQFFDTLQAANLSGFTARRIAVIPITPEAISAQQYTPLATPNSMFLIDRKQSTLPAVELAEQMQALRKAGCKTALYGVSLDVSEAPLLDACDAAFLYLSDYPLPQFQNLMRRLRTLYPAIKIAVDGVGTWDEQRMCLAWGADYCLGSFLATIDTVDPEASIDQSRMTSIELLNLLRNDAELGALTDVAKRDPGLAFQVLRWANAPSNGRQTQITSLQEAIVVLGRTHLYRWLTVSMFRLGGAQERDEALLEVALGRARFLEMVGAGIPQSQRDELFLVGLLSLFDVMLKAPMAAIVDKMHLSAAIREVLLDSSGPYGPYLMLLIMIERGQVSRAAEVALSIGIAPETLGDTSTAAFQWAQEALQ